MEQDPYSRNPRRRRALAHSLIARARHSDRYAGAALIAAYAASHTRKGEALVPNALVAATRGYQIYPGSLHEVDSGTITHWIDDDLALAIHIVNTILPGESGISVFTPENPDDYADCPGSFAGTIRYDPERGMTGVVATGTKIMTVDCSVPGARFRLDAAHTLLRHGSDTHTSRLYGVSPELSPAP